MRHDQLNEKNSPINIRSDLFDVKAIGSALHEIFRVGDVKEINFEKQIDWRPLPHLKDFAIVFEQQFLLWMQCVVVFIFIFSVEIDKLISFFFCLQTHPFEDDIIGLDDQNKYARAGEKESGGEQKEDAWAKGKFPFVRNKINLVQLEERSGLDLYLIN